MVGAPAARSRHAASAPTTAPTKAASGHQLPTTPSAYSGGSARGVVGGLGPLPPIPPPSSAGMGGGSARGVVPGPPPAPPARAGGPNGGTSLGGGSVYGWGGGTGSAAPAPAPAASYGGTSVGGGVAIRFVDPVTGAETEV